MSFVMDDGDVFYQHGGTLGAVWLHLDNPTGVNTALSDVLCAPKDSCRAERNSQTVVISINLFISKNLNLNISISNGAPLLTKTLQVIVSLWYQRLEIIFLVLPQYMSLKKEMQI